MKLNVFFVFMDLITMIVYPILFLYNKLNTFLKLKERAAHTDLFVTDSVESVK
jgi:bacteriorhodopsin